MDKPKNKKQRLWYSLAALVLVLGCLASAILIVSTLSSYPALITAAYNSPLKKVEVPGAVDLELSREGAYAVYYEDNRGVYSHAERPPKLDCQLTSKRAGKDIPLVPDYVPTNRYATKDGRVGVLVYSTTIENPGLHTLSCDYPDGRLSPKLVLAIGPNYFFEFFRVVWKMGVSILGSAGVLCGSVVISVGIASVVVILSRSKRSVEAGKVDYPDLNL